MCFLYRQSISIVYESKFKYIYRYFIKIDRCFCGILQSLPLRKCGLKYEFKHFSDDRDDGYLGFRVFEDNEKCKQREIDAYQIEIELAKRLKRSDMVKRLESLRNEEVKKYE